MKFSKRHVVIVGAGLAGLAAAREIESLGGQTTLLESSNAVGGRLRTDCVDGFLLDRGFQVLLDSYPELRRCKEVSSLGLKYFQSGALCRMGHSWTEILNPLRHPIRAMKSLTSFPPGLLSDFFKLLSPLISLRAPKGSTSKLLDRLELSEAMVERFLRPFFGGVFLESELITKASLFQTYLRRFVLGRAGLPREGIQQFPNTLKKSLLNTEILLNHKVTSVASNEVKCGDGFSVKGDAVVVAVSSPEMSKLIPLLDPPSSLKVTCLYFELERGVIDAQPILYLGEGGAINNLCFPSIIQPTYAPAGKELVSVTVVDPAWQASSVLEKTVCDELEGWFGPISSCLRLLRKYTINHALPNQRNLPSNYGQVFVNGIYLAGEVTDFASINQALASGRLAGREAMTHLE